MVAEAGMDPIRYVSTKDPIDRYLMEVVSDRVMDRRETFDQNLAVRIAAEVGKMFGGK